ncbi:MAG TPA: hypothetical protein VGJ50_32525 [Streptosporangiaceae bacterium]
MCSGDVGLARPLVFVKVLRIAGAGSRVPEEKEGEPMPGDLGRAAGHAGQDQGHHDDGRLAHGASLSPLCSRHRAGPGFRDWRCCWQGDELAFWPGDRLSRADQVVETGDHPAQPGRHLDNRPQFRGFEFGSFEYRCALCGRLSPYLGGLAFRGLGYRCALPGCLP